MAPLLLRTVRGLTKLTAALTAYGCAQIVGLTGDYQQAAGGRSALDGASGTGGGNGGANANTGAGGRAGANTGNVGGAGSGNAGSAGSGNRGGAGSSNAGGAGSSNAGGAGSSNAGGANGGTAGSSGHAGSAGMPSVGDTIPADYPAPTASNRSQCVTVQPQAGVCPDGRAAAYCLQCLFGGDAYDPVTAAAEAGNYLVTLRLGGALAGGVSVSAEANRGLLAPVNMAAGESHDYVFVVNVRDKEGMPSSVTTPNGHPGLDLFFSGSTPPQVSVIGYSTATANTKPVVVYIASDNTAGDQLSGFGGWGQMLPEFFKAPVAVANYGNTGASSASFYSNSALWGAIKAQWNVGDWVMIQFGYNDKGLDSSFQSNLEMYIADARAAGVNPIVISAPARLTGFTTMVADQSPVFPTLAKQAAAGQAVPFIDLTALSSDWYNSIGLTEAMTFHANGTDPSHTNLAGAEKLASLVAGAIKTQGISLSKYLRQ